ncbi:hypothetical protein ACQ1ZU_16805 [Enterococcus faecalis]|uniref:hypothetical protein n=1 Tax=Enterococcus faecalis TaxID=1351 RepID=UPI003D6A739C
MERLIKACKKNKERINERGRRKGKGKKKGKEKEIKKVTQEEGSGLPIRLSKGATYR